MNSKLSKWKILFLIFLIIGTVYILNNHKPEVYHTNQGYIFGTNYTIKYQSTDDLQSEIVKTLLDVDNSLSMFNGNSIIRAFNENRDTIANDMFTEVFTLAQEVSEKTGGAFDITVAPLVNAWGFGHENSTTPDSATIEKRREAVGYRTVALVDGKIVKQNSATTLDCSAIAKGYGCDAVARLLESKGVKNYMVEIGGEVVTKGVNDKGKKWVISISRPDPNPTATTNEHQAIIEISGRGMATSGNYRNFRKDGDRIYAHTIDPRTGYPVQHSLLSATVVADNCATADAYATAFMVMGTDKAIELCKAEKIEAYFIYADENGELKTHTTEGFGKYIVK